MASARPGYGDCPINQLLKRNPRWRSDPPHQPPKPPMERAGAPARVVRSRSLLGRRAPCPILCNAVPGEMRRHPVLRRPGGPRVAGAPDLKSAGEGADSLPTSVLLHAVPSRPSGHAREAVFGGFCSSIEGLAGISEIGRRSWHSGYPSSSSSPRCGWRVQYSTVMAGS